MIGSQAANDDEVESESAWRQHKQPTTMRWSRSLPGRQQAAATTGEVESESTADALQQQL